MSAAVLNVTLMCRVVARLLDPLRTPSERDALTGLYKRRALTDRMSQHGSAWERRERVFAKAVVDRDHFKRINVTHGHDAGDRVLAGAAQRMRALVRGEDVLARVGGEAFVVVLPEPGRPGAMHVMDSTELIETLFRYSANGVPIRM